MPESLEEGAHGGADLPVEIRVGKPSREIDVACRCPGARGPRLQALERSQNSGCLQTGHRLYLLARRADEVLRRLIDVVVPRHGVALEPGALDRRPRERRGGRIVLSLDDLDLVNERVEAALHDVEGDVPGARFQTGRNETVAHKAVLRDRLVENIRHVPPPLAVVRDVEEHGRREGDLGRARDGVKAHRIDRGRLPEVECDEHPGLAAELPADRAFVCPEAAGLPELPVREVGLVAAFAVPVVGLPGERRRFAQRQVRPRQRFDARGRCRVRGE